MFGAPLVEDPRLFDLLGKADFCTAPGKIKIISKFCVFVTQMMRSKIENRLFVLVLEQQVFFLAYFTPRATPLPE